MNAASNDVGNPKQRERLLTAGCTPKQSGGGFIAPWSLPQERHPAQHNKRNTPAHRTQKSERRRNRNDRTAASREAPIRLRNHAGHHPRSLRAFADAPPRTGNAPKHRLEPDDAHRHHRCADGADADGGWRGGGAVLQRHRRPPRAGRHGRGLSGALSRAGGAV